MNEEQKTIIELQQHVLLLVVKVGCLEELLVGSVIDEDSYKEKVKKAIGVANSIVSDKIKEIAQPVETDKETTPKE